MATIYRFIIEQKQASNGGDSGRSGKGRATKGAAKKGKDLPLLFGGGKGGVEHNRKMRAINPILNKITNGVWEKGMRLTRAGAGLVRKNTETGKISFSGVSITIFAAFILSKIWSGFVQWNQMARAEADKLNAQNFKAMENGSGTIHGAYRVMYHGLTGRQTYNENK